MKLLIATPLYPPESGGPATYTKLLEEGLPALGIQVEVVKFSDVRHLPKLIRHFAFYHNVLKGAHNSDAVLALDGVSVGLPAMKAAKKANKPFFVKIVGDYAWEQGTQRFGVTASLDEFVLTSHVPLPVALLRRVQKEVVASAVRVIVPSNYLKGVVEKWGIASGKIDVLYNSVSLEQGGVIPREVVIAKRPHVVSVGRLVPWKNMKGVIDAMAKLGSGTLTIVGDGPERGTLESYAKKELPHTIFTGELSHADTLAVINDADVFVLNSTYEGLSHLLIEALSLGTSVIATRAGGNIELIENERHGALIPVNDTEALVRALPEALVRLKNTSNEFVARFTPETMLEKTATLLKKHS